MKKYIILWISLTVVIGIVLFEVTSLVSNTTFDNVFLVFDTMLILIGFTAVLSTVLVCTKFISDKIDK